MKILVVDDARDMQLILRRILTLMGHQVVLANHGQEAWELLQQHNFQVVISDWVMPIMDGPTLCRTIRAAELPHYVYIILLTGMSSKQNLILGMEAGADDFATKPIVREELEVRLRAAQRVLNLEQTLEDKNRNLEGVNQSLSATQALIQSDLKRAASLQTGVLPVHKAFGRLCVDWFFQPAQYIGGDTFNYFPINDDLFFFYSIDVSGHGISAALLSMCLQTLLSSTGELYCQDELTRENAATFPARLAENLNHHLNHVLDTGDHYLTLIMGVVDTAEERLHFVQAGHPQPFLYNPSTQQIERIDCTGFPIGLMPDMEYETISLPFPTGSRFVLYSDGILELHHASGEPMTEDDLQSCLQALIGLPARELVSRLGEQLGLGKENEDKPDDISLLIIDSCG
ncbi:PP2C family protein-serine/threonine phosphatase [Thiothrix lacustris]|jgi:sigma-B regulation protein RsbU (phosphoserine phosphatase)|uniref:SpoIIE family protein phosphatase n=1 Tax=Thiothrix lacustris TaxID=525917 RepID=A0ABY9MVL4_9GAMM|nr:SpoIIE family protein phosphatase [Thiothrix lacustris]WML91460.1 SpoIIE family protein phosphatase [Thiothrix lacustris]WMP16687.1 SpoIIE family protein phosphatase [Thiothrix lacustris]